MPPAFATELLRRVSMGASLGLLDTAWTVLASRSADPLGPTLMSCCGAWVAIALFVAPQRRRLREYAPALCLCAALISGLALAPDLGPWSGRLAAGLAIALCSARVIPPRVGGIAMVVALACWPLRVAPSTLASSSAVGPSILWVTVDTFRADGRSGSAAALAPRLTPFLDALAAQGCSVEPAYATSPLTGPSHAAMLTGHHPIDLGILLNGRPLPSEVPSVATDLAAAGYRTEGYVSTAMLDARLGYAAGFQTYDDALDAHGTARRSAVGFMLPAREVALLERPGEETLRRFAAGGAVEGPLFAWVHLYDAHRPYTPAPESRALVSEPVALPPATDFDSHPVGPPPTHGAAAAQVSALRAEVAPAGPLPTRDPRRLRDDTATQAVAAYLGEVHEVDALVARAFAIFEARTGSPPDAWMVVADHGESLTEHHELGSHQRHLYRANTEVPLLMSSGCPPGPVSTLGVADHLRAAAGIAAPRPWPDSIVSAVIGPPHGVPAGAPVRKVMLRDGPREVLVTLPPGGRTTEVYDLASDPHERFPLPHDPALLLQVEPWVQRLEGREVEEVDATLGEALKALGYAQ